MSIGLNKLKSLSLGALPFADAASEGLPQAQLLRLSLFQISAMSSPRSCICSRREGVRAPGRQGVKSRNWTLF